MKNFYSYLPIFLKRGYSSREFSNILREWHHPHRGYHGPAHLSEMTEKIEELDSDHRELLIIAAFYHDLVYDVKDPLDNEKKSAEIFVADANAINRRSEKPKFSSRDIDLVHNLILVTEERNRPGTGKTVAEKLCRIFWDMDNSVLFRDFSGLLRWEREIFQEWQGYSLDNYRKGRTKFLENEIARQSSLKRNNVENLRALAQYVKIFEPKIGVYPGSFDPFHVGHFNVLEKAERMCDKVILLKGINPEKPLNSKSLAETFPEIVRNREIVEWSNMTHFYLDHVKSQGANVSLVRGLRNGKDLDYEVNQLRFMEEFYPDVNVMYVQCDKQFEHVSSSAIRNILKFDPELGNRYLLKNQNDD